MNKGNGLPKHIERDVYEAGRASRAISQTVGACPYALSMQPVHRAWWLAGFHDRDMELLSVIRR